MSRSMGRALLALCIGLSVATNAAAGQTKTTSETKTFEVIAVDGNQLVVRLPEGTREITVPSDFRFNVDGQQMSVQQLKPGMKGTATITTKTTVSPVTATEVKNGEVMQASGASIIVRTDSGIKMFTQGDIDKRGVKIMRDGQRAEIADLHAGDRLTATIVTAKPPRVLTEKEVSATLARSSSPAGSAAGAPRSAPAPSGGQPAATVGSPAPASAAGATRTLPKTASPRPTMLISGLLLLTTAALLSARRRRLR